MRSADLTDRRLRVDRLAWTNRARQFDTGPTEICDDAAHGARGQSCQCSDDQGFEDRGFDGGMLVNIGFIAPARIDLQRTQRVQPALRKVEGAARPVYEGFAGNQILEIQAGLLDKRSI